MKRRKLNSRKVMKADLLSNEFPTSTEMRSRAPPANQPETLRIAATLERGANELSYLVIIRYGK